MSDFLSILDYISRKIPVIGAIALVIIAGGCIYTIVTGTTNLLNVLPLALTLLLLLAAFWLVRRTVARRAERTRSEAKNDVAVSSAEDIWDGYHQRQQSLEAERRGQASEPVPERVPAMRPDAARPRSARQRLTLLIIPGAIGGFIVVLGLTTASFYTDQSNGVTTHTWLNGAGQLFGLCLLPISLVAGGWLGIVGGSSGRAVAARLGFKAKTLDVFTVICAGLTGAAGAFILDVCSWIGASM